METSQFHNEIGVAQNQIPQGLSTRADQFSRTNYLMETYHLEYAMTKVLALLQDKHPDAAKTAKDYLKHIKHRVSINPRNTSTLGTELDRDNERLFYPNTVKALETWSYKRSLPTETPQGDAWTEATKEPDDSPFWVPFYKADPAQRQQQRPAYNNQYQDYRYQ